MKKEIAFIFKVGGFSDAVFYFFYKIKLWIRLHSFFQRRKQQRIVRIDKMYATLQILHGGSIEIDGKQYLQKILPFNKNITISLRPYSSDIKVYDQVILNEEYKPVVEIYKQLFDKEPELIFDCGANIGMASLYFNHHFPSAHITLIEPFKQNCNLIKTNFLSAGFNKFELIEGGVWNKDTRLSINRQFRDGKEWSVSLEESTVTNNSVLGFSMLKMLENRQGLIDILKIDIEGTEKQLFENGEYASMFLKNVRCLVIEIHDEFNIREHIYQVLKLNGFIFFTTNEITIAINRTFL